MYPVEKFRHTGVNPDGTFKRKRGAVKVHGCIYMSHEDGGCPVQGCSCAGGHWISIIRPRTPEGVVNGFIYKFDSNEELLLAIQKHDLPLLTDDEWSKLESMLSDENVEYMAMGRMFDKP